MLIINITQIKIIKPQNIETTSLGVAYLAALNIGLINNTAHIEKLWKKNKIAKPKLSKKKLMPLIQRWRKSINTLIKLNS